MSTPNTQQTINTCQVRFPNLHLDQRQAHYLRGFFGNYFKAHSPLLHNHYANGTLRQGYSLVQYKVIDHVPTLIGLQEGAMLLHELFTQVHHLEIGAQKLPVQSKQVQQHKFTLGVDPSGLHTYAFSTPWMALNEENHRKYQKANATERKALLQRILIGNIMVFYKEMGLRLAPTERVLLTLTVHPVTTRFKNIKMTAFKGQFTTNAQLPNFIGLGKSASRGFGTISQAAE